MPPPPAPSVPFTTIHNGTTYGTVTSPLTGKVWLDRNLEASQVCTSLDDSACYGDHYQWARNFDGHEKSTSNRSTTQATNVGHSDFIKVDSFEDWASVDSNGSTRSANWSKTDGSSVCPVGFRVPNITELEADTINNGITNKNTAFTSFLKLPSAGFRSRDTKRRLGTHGYFWSLSPVYDDSVYVEYSSSVDSDNDPRWFAYSVRCIKD